MKRILISGVMAASLLISVSASAAATPVYLTDNLGQLLAPVTSTLLTSQPGVVTGTAPTAQTVAPTSSMEQIATTNPSQVTSTDTYQGAANTIDMNNRYLTLIPASHVSSYNYPSLKLSSKLTNELYAASAGLLAFGLILAFGLLERAHAIDLGRLLNRKNATEELV